MIYIKILTVTIISFIIGTFWFSKLFGKTWERINSSKQNVYDKLPITLKNSTYLMIAEFLSTFFICYTLSIFVNFTQSWLLAGFLFWVGFILPTTVSTTIWGLDDKKNMFKRIVISSSFRLVTVLLSGFILLKW
jgi:hypothetical protein